MDQELRQRHVGMCSVSFVRGDMWVVESSFSHWVIQSLQKADATVIATEL